MPVVRCVGWLPWRWLLWGGRGSVGVCSHTSSAAANVVYKQRLFWAKRGATTLDLCGHESWVLCLAVHQSAPLATRPLTHTFGRP